MKLLVTLLALVSLNAFAAPEVTKNMVCTGIHEGKNVEIQINLDDKQMTSSVTTIVDGKITATFDKSAAIFSTQNDFKVFSVTAVEGENALVVYISSILGNFAHYVPGAYDAKSLNQNVVEINCI